jgi:hypothetical protein
MPTLCGQNAELLIFRECGSLHIFTTGLHTQKCVACCQCEMDHGLQCGLGELLILSSSSKDDFHLNIMCHRRIRVDDKMERKRSWII